MEAVGRKVESQVQFWSLLGPFLVLLSIAVLIFKVSVHWYFPVSALIGIPLCVKWKMKGMAVALCSLLLLSGIGYQNLELDDRYWHVGLALAMAFSFIVMTLSLEEAQGLVAKIQLESQSRLDNFALLDEKLKTVELEWAEEREKTKSEAAALTLEVARAQEEKQTFHKLAQLEKEELIQVRGQHEQLLLDLFYKKQQIAQLRERLEETELSLQDFVNSNGEKQIGELTGQLDCLEREKEVLKAKLGVAQNDAQTLKNKLSFLEEERQAHQEAKVSLQQQCEQMRQAETQQRQLLQQAQQKIHEFKIKLMEDEQQQETFAIKTLELNEQINQLERVAVQKEEQCRAAVQEVRSQMHEQKSGFEVQIDKLKQASDVQSAQKLIVAEQEIKAVQQQLQQIQQENANAHQCLEAQARELLQKSNELLHTRQEAELLRGKLVEHENQANAAVNKIEALQALHTQLEEVLRNTQEAYRDAEQKLEEIQQKREKLPYAIGNTRHIEAMYLQLKGQFQDKCNVLDSTRRELFHLNEELLKRKKDEDEERLYGMPAAEKMLQKDLVRLGRQFDQMQHRYQEEIEGLASLVEHLLRELSEIR